jgi:F0F1-type ATP synthase assembly protein I
MKAPNPQPVKNRPLQDYNLRVVAIGGEVGCITLAIVLVAVFGGLWLDRILGTKPVITFLLVLASAPLALILTFRIAIRSIQGMTANHPQPTGGKPDSSKEEADQ